MSKKSAVSKWWVAVVHIRNPYSKKDHFSVLTFPAQNRFYAVRRLEEELPSNPQLIDESENLLPYNLLRFHQIKAEDSEEVILFYQDALADFIKESTGVDINSPI